jgi:flagellar hook-associated protein 3 FlgL
MSSLTPLNPRTTGLMRDQQLLNQLQQTRQQLFEKQQQISSGKRFDRPSDGPGEVSSLLYLKRQMAAREQYQRNLDHAGSVLDTADQALGDATDVLRQAKSIASSQIGVGSDEGTRQAEAQVVDSKLDSLMRIANRQFEDMPLFGGNSVSGADDRVFESFLGGIRYTGSQSDLATRVGQQATERFNTNGVDAFGALSARIQSEVDLNPQPVAETPLDTLNGAQGRGIRQGAVRVTVNGTDATVDLTNADTLGDVTTRINEAINDINGAAGSLSIAGNGLELTASGGNTIAISDIEAGNTAADLGMAISATGGTTTGGDVQATLTPTTQLSNLGASIDLASGLRITQGEKTTTVDFSGDSTIQDMQNTIDSLDLGLRLQINDQQNGLNLVSDVSGIELTVGENGGTTGQDLGLRSFNTQTRLSDFRHGKGVDIVEGENDLAISMHDGTSFKVNLDGASTVQDVINKIQTAASGAGVAVGSDLVVGLANTGTGFRLEDNTAGGNDFAIANASTSNAASNLGLAGNVGGANTLNGEDKAKVRAENLFTHMIDLRDSLQQNDTDGITFAGSGLEKDLDQVIQARGELSAQAKQVEDVKKQSEDRALAEQTMLSNIEDTNMTEAITRFSQLQQQLQASLRVSGQTMQQSLLDFLR